MPSKHTRTARGMALVLSGLLVGMLLITPATAHFTQNPRHLGVHAWNQVIKDRVYTKKQANNRFYTKGQVNNLFQRRLFAVVDSAGLLQRGRGAVGATRAATGNYRVTFNRNVSQCAFIASAGGATTNSFWASRNASTGQLAGQPNQVVVLVVDNDTNVTADASFHLEVVC